MAEKRFLLVTVGCGIVQATHAMIYGFGSIHWEALGYSGNVIGLFWAIGVFAEVVLFQFSAQVLRRVTPLHLAIIGAGSSITDAYIGPYTAVGENVRIEKAELEHSIVMPGSSIRDLAGRIEASLIGKDVDIHRSPHVPRAYRFVVGDSSEISIL